MIQFVPGYITATNQTAAGPASTVRFTVSVQLEEGPVVLESVKSSGPKPDDAVDVDTRPYTNAGNNFVIGYRHPDTRIRWSIPMYPAMIACE